MVIKANKCHIKQNSIQQNTIAKSRIDQYSEIKVAYIDIQEFINGTHRIISIHKYLYYMHIKNYLIHLQKNICKTKDYRESLVKMSMEPMTDMKKQLKAK